MNQFTEHNLTTTKQISLQIQHFWKIDKPITINQFIADETKCEEHYIKNTKRDKHGKYNVKMPLQFDPIVLEE